MDSDGQTDHVAGKDRLNDGTRVRFLSPLPPLLTFFSKVQANKRTFLRERGMAYPLKLFCYGDVR